MSIIAGTTILAGAGAFAYAWLDVWFVFVLVGLGILVIAGLYVRRRLTDALKELGVSPRIIRIARWAILL